jgi:predicted DNA-binding mobile mystery protein A
MSDLSAARRSLDQRLSPLRQGADLRPPPKGWLRAIRQSLGMTTAQLAHRIGISQPSAVELEQSEARRTITLKTLERAAEALNCTLVYALVPREPLDGQMTEQARRVAARHLASAAHSMRLEDQGTTPAVEARELEALVDRLIKTRPARLWDR